MKKLYVNNKKIITPNFKGFNFVHQMYEYMPDKLGRELTPKMVKLEYEIFEKMRVRSIRSFYGSSLSWDNVKKDYNFESTHMKAFYKSCLDFQKMGIDIGITPQWQFKGFLAPPLEGEYPNGVNIGRFDNVVENDLEATAKNFEKFVERSVLEFEKHGIHNIKYLYCFTECNNTFNHRNKEEKLAKKMPLVECREYDELIPIFARFIEAVDRGLKNAGKRDQYKIVAPCDNWRADDRSEPYSILVKYCLEHLADKIDIIGSHNGYDRHHSYTDDNYYYHPYKKMVEPIVRAKQYGKEFWIDEYNAAIHGNYLSWQKRTSNRDPYKGLALGALVNSIMNMGGVSNLMLWTLFDQQWPDHTNDGGFDKGVLVCGYYPDLLVEQTPLAPWYSASLISRYVGAGDVYECKVADSTYVSALKRNDGEITVVVTNYDDKLTEIEINFEKNLGGKKFYKYIFDPKMDYSSLGNEMISCSGSVGEIETKITDKLSGYAMVIYTTEKPE